MSARPKVWVSKSWRDYLAGFKKIHRQLDGIEWLTALFFYALWVATLAFWLRIILCRYSEIRETVIVEIYVVSSVIVTILVWWWFPTLRLIPLCSYFSLGPVFAILCSWFLFSTVVVLLHVVLLSKVFGDIYSAERSLILFIFNVVQLVFTFSIWYELEAEQTKGDALFNAILVFATVGYPDKAPALVVGTQIAADFLLLAIFLAHIVGRVGYRKNRISEGEITRQTILHQIGKLKK
jgi:hypothetical protein